MEANKLVLFYASMNLRQQFLMHRVLQSCLPVKPLKPFSFIWRRLRQSSQLLAQKARHTVGSHAKSLDPAIAKPAVLQTDRCNLSKIECKV